MADVTGVVYSSAGTPVVLSQPDAQLVGSLAVVTGTLPSALFLSAVAIEDLELPIARFISAGAAEELDPAGTSLYGLAAEVIPSDQYYMRAEGDPGPGYVYWTSTTLDYDGVDAPSPIQAGTAVNIGLEEYGE